MGPLALSVIVPMRDGARFLPQSLAALIASDLPRSRWELIVVDDSSTDQSADIAAKYADRVVLLTNGSRGPAYARNRGAELARGEAVMFVDADVSVHSDALRRTAELFDNQPDVAAVFGCYDSNPAAKGLLSQYRNLLHRYVHLRERGDAVTFWAGCGAVRADVFKRLGGFDESLRKASVEDIELGYRLSDRGHRIVLLPDIQGRHLKRWTFQDMIVTDVQQRGVPWLRILLTRRKVRPTATLSIRRSEQACTALMALCWLAGAAWLWTQETIWLVIVGVALTSILIVNQPLITWLAQQRGWRFAAAAIPLRLLYYVLNMASVTIALATLVLPKWPPVVRAGPPGNRPTPSITKLQ